MIHQTFYRLPDEKRARLLASAHREFTQHTYEKTSINRILDEAKIPKGSFYQYFDDKSDLFYLCIFSVYEKIIAARTQNNEPLLNSGLIRMMNMGYDKGYELFSEDLHSILEEDDFILVDYKTDRAAPGQESLLIEQHLRDLHIDHVVFDQKCALAFE